jgi:GR25 family glycosyltransferase involved in LPS biosynthesis
MKKNRDNIKNIILKKIEIRNNQTKFLETKGKSKMSTNLSERDRLRIHGNKTPIIQSNVNETAPKFDIQKYININNNNINTNIIEHKNEYFLKNNVDNSIIISYKESSEVRKNNLKLVLIYLSQLLIKNKTELILVEQDDISKVNWLNEIPNNEFINHIFLKNIGIFNKGWGYNVAAKESLGKNLIFHDSDMFLKFNTYENSLKLLDEFDVVNPYNVLYDLNNIEIDQFINKEYDFSVVNRKKEYTNSPISGGIFFIKKEKYWQLKGFDENCFGYGPEDKIFDDKIIKFNLKVNHLNDITIHIHHDRDWCVDNYYFFRERNDELFKEYQKMSVEDLKNKTNKMIIIDNNTNINMLNKNLNDYFSKIYCINLDERQDKYNDCLNEFKKLNIDVERVSAVDGKISFKPGLNLNAGNYGLVLTNINIINDAIKNKYNSILILEDDIMFIDEFYKFFNEKMLSLPDDWDLLYIGGNHQFNVGKFNLITGDLDFIPNKDNYKTLNHELCKTTWTQTTHAVAINSKYYDTLIKAINDYSTLPIDMIYCKLQQLGCNTYTFLPSLALQRPSYSDIENVFVDYNKDCTF